MALVTKEKNGKSTADKHDIKGSVGEVLKDKNNKDEANKVISPERSKALGLALDSIKKAYGDGSIMRLGDSDRPASKPYQQAHCRSTLHLESVVCHAAELSKSMVLNHLVKLPWLSTLPPKCRNWVVSRLS